MNLVKIITETQVQPFIGKSMMIGGKAYVQKGTQFRVAENEGYKPLVISTKPQDGKYTQKYIDKGSYISCEWVSVVQASTTQKVATKSKDEDSEILKDEKTSFPRAETLESEKNIDQEYKNCDKEKSEEKVDE